MDDRWPRATDLMEVTCCTHKSRKAGRWRIEPAACPVRKSGPLQAHRLPIASAYSSLESADLLDTETYPPHGSLNGY